jgi:STE24 endopeptidase
MVRGQSDPAGLPLLLAVVSVYFFAMTPVTNSMMRTNESQADIFGLNVARQPDGFARVAIRLSDYRKLDPGPLEEIFFYDHPSGRARVEMCMRWKAEQLRAETRGAEARAAAARAAVTRAGARDANGHQADAGWPLFPWAMLDLNQRLPPCEDGTLPLS